MYSFPRRYRGFLQTARSADSERRQVRGVLYDVKMGATLTFIVAPNCTTVKHADLVFPLHLLDIAWP